MRMWLVSAIALVDILCTSKIEELVENMGKKIEEALPHEFDSAEKEALKKHLKETAGLGTRLMVPCIFHEDRVVASPTTRYQDIDEEEKGYVEKVIALLPRLLWRSVAYIYVFGNDSWVVNLMEEVFETAPFKKSDAVALYKRARGRLGIRLIDLVNRTFRHNIGMLNRFGQRLAQEAGAKIQEISSSLSDEEKRKEEKMLQIIKEYGENLCTKEKQEEIIRAQEIMCDACACIWERDSNRESFVMETYSRHLYLRMMGSSMDVEEPLLSYIDHRGLIDAYEKYKSIDIVAELIKQVFTERGCISDESVNDAVCGVREREEAEKMRGEEERRKKEEESLRNTLELLRMEEKEKSKGRGKKKKGGKKGSGEVTAKMEEEKKDSEEVEESAEAEVSLEEMAVGGARSKERSSKKRVEAKDIVTRCTRGFSGGRRVPRGSRPSWMREVRRSGEINRLRRLRSRRRYMI
ncbi:DUF1609 domain-containing protein [Encephalitozoon cuniculi]|nr:DUF1609 domain-containing protein [Encephalitozoon cuniculi]